MGAAAGGAIGTVFGPLGTVVGTGIGAAVGWIVQQIGASLVRLGAERVALRAPNGKYLCAHNGGGGNLTFECERVAEWETFTLQIL